MYKLVDFPVACSCMHAYNILGSYTHSCLTPPWFLMEALGAYGDYLSLGCHKSRKQRCEPPSNYPLP